LKPLNNTSYAFHDIYENYLILHAK
jgi:hypothetical protein